MKMRLLMFSLLVSACLVALPAVAKAQSFDSMESPSVIPGATSTQLALPYTPPSQSAKFHNYLFDAFGPYPISVYAVVAGIDQEYKSPPEWQQGIKGYSERFGSDIAIAAVSTTTHYALAQAFKEDTLYYRCECKGVLPRLRHAVLSTLTGRRGADGHSVFSVSALVAPYVGSMAAVYGWYPDRFGAKDAFRMGNYSLLTYMGGNISLEFFSSGPHSLLSRMHLNNTHAAPAQVPDPVR